jgi:hypothetical protein
MRTSKNIMSIENDRTKLSATKRRIVAVGLALAVAAGAAHVTYAGTSPTPPVGKCTDFACEQ